MAAWLKAEALDVPISTRSFLTDRQSPQHSVVPPLDFAEG
jgi:hypothetical protein